MTRRSQGVLFVVALAVLAGAFWLFNSSTKVSEAEHGHATHQEARTASPVSILEQGRANIAQPTGGTVSNSEQVSRPENEEDEPKAFGKLRGAVYDAMSGEMQPNHTVYFLDGSRNGNPEFIHAVSDADGNYIAELPAGEWAAYYYGVVIEGARWESGTFVGNVIVKADTVKLFDFALEGTRTLSGRITFEEDGPRIRLWLVQQPTQRVLADGVVATHSLTNNRPNRDREVDNDDLDPKDYPPELYPELYAEGTEWGPPKPGPEIHWGSGHFWIQGLTPEVYELRAFLDGPKASIERSILVATANLFDGDVELEHRELTWADFGMGDWETLPVERHK